MIRDPFNSSIHPEQVVSLSIKFISPIVQRTNVVSLLVAVQSKRAGNEILAVMLVGKIANPVTKARNNGFVTSSYQFKNKV